MAQTLDGSQYPQVVRFTLGASNIQTQVNIPRTASKFTVRAFSNDLNVSFTGSDGGSLGANYVTIDADAWAEISLMDGINQAVGILELYLSSATGSTVVECMVEG